MENEQCTCISNIMNQWFGIYQFLIVNRQIEEKYIKYFLQKRKNNFYILLLYSFIIKKYH